MSGCRAALLAVASLSAVLSPAAAAVTFTVNSTGDASDVNPGDGKCETASGNGVCTLRAALDEANRTTGATIVLPAGTYVLTAPHGFLEVIASLTINGAGAATTLVDANLLNDSALYIYSNLDQPADVLVSGLTIENAVGTMVSAFGGVQVYGSNVTMEGVTIHSCSSPDAGGGIKVVSGSLKMNGCSIHHCTAGTTGGGISSTGDVVLTGTTIDHCFAPGDSGGGIFQDGYSLSITSSTLSSSTAIQGGGLFVAGAGPTPLIAATSITGNFASNAGGGVATSRPLQIVGSTIAANASDGYGGGVAVNNGSLILVNSTISGNSARSFGGGIFSNASTSLYSTTVTNNQADSDLNGSGMGGGVYDNPSTPFTFVDSIIAMNSESQPFLSGYTYADGDCAGTITSQGHSILNNYNGARCTVLGSFSLQDPKLAALASNGGLTQTHALLAGSPAMDAGDAGAGGCKDQLAATITTDQRGVHRLGAACDIGSYEYGSPKGDVNGDGLVNVADVFYLINYLFAAGPVPPGRADANGDATVSVGDVFYLINFLFAGGPAPE